MKAVFWGILVAVVTTPALAQLPGVGEAATLSCDGGPKVVRGTGNAFRVIGYCSVLTVNGIGNSVVVDRAGSILVKGTGNLVDYINLNPNPKNPKKPLPPKQSVSGTGNLISWTKGIVPKAAGEAVEESR
jgi:Protein of unknown function (DUF3060)